MYKKLHVNTISIESKIHEYLYISIDDIRATYEHQEHMIWNSFNKCT